MRYELIEEGDKVRLVLTHLKLETGDTVLGVCGGWHTHLNVLEDILNGDTLRGFYRMQERYERDYRDRLRQQGIVS